MLMDWKTQQSKDVNSSQIHLRLNVIPINIPARFLVDLGKLILKCIWKGIGPRIA